MALALAAALVNYPDSTIVMSLDASSAQIVLSWLPGYMWDRGTIRSTGSAIPPTMHLREDGEIICYARPIFREGATVGLFLKMSGIKTAVERGDI